LGGMMGLFGEEPVVIPKEEPYKATKLSPFEFINAIHYSKDKLIFDDWFLENYPDYYHKYQTQDYFERYEIERLVAESEREKYWETTKNAFLKDKKIIRRDRIGYCRKIK
jgi:hypothetical protein